MKKIIYMSAYLNDATSFYRLMPLEYLKSDSFTIERKPYMGDITFATFIGYDALILCRPSSQNDLYIIKLAKQCGLKVIADFDDDILHIDQYNPMYGVYERDKQTVIDCLMESDEVWVSTQGIAHSFRFYASKKTVVILNRHDDRLFPIANKKAFNPNTKKAIWRGGASHQSDVYEVADKIIETVNNNKDWFFEFVGCRFIYMEQRCGDNYLPVSPMPLLQYFQYMMDANPNIVYFPLSDTIMNKGKSNISYIESAYFGAAFFGQRNLPEFQNQGVIDISQLKVGMTTNFEMLSDYNKLAWENICDTLLLSKANQIRKERLEAI